MSVATFGFQLPRADRFVAKGGRPFFELALGYLAVAVALFPVGPGRASLDWLIFGRPSHAAGSPFPS